MPTYNRRFTLTIDGEIEIEADSPEEADAKLKYLPVWDLLNNVVIDDPYNGFTVDVAADNDDDWSVGDPNFPENDLLPDQDAYGDDTPDRDDYNPGGF